MMVVPGLSRRRPKDAAITHQDTEHHSEPCNEVVVHIASSN
jgi:hypothetical protein